MEPREAFLPERNHEVSKFLYLFPDFLLSFKKLPRGITEAQNALSMAFREAGNDVVLRFGMDAVAYFL
jgi:hypothetical protein